MDIERVILKVKDRQGYSPEQVTQTMALHDLHRAIEQAIEDFGPDTLIVTDNGDRYGATFGGIDPYADTFTADSDDGGGSPAAVVLTQRLTDYGS